MKIEASVPYFLPAAWLMGPGYCAVTAFIAPWGGDIGQIELVRPTTLQMIHDHSDQKETRGNLSVAIIFPVLKKWTSIWLYLFNPHKENIFLKIYLFLSERFCREKERQMEGLPLIGSFPPKSYNG